MIGTSTHNGTMICVTKRKPINHTIAQPMFGCARRGGGSAGTSVISGGITSSLYGTSGTAGNSGSCISGSSDDISAPSVANPPARFEEIIQPRMPPRVPRRVADGQHRDGQQSIAHD